MNISGEKFEYLKVLTGTFDALEPFIIGNRPFSETVDCFARFAQGFLPLKGLVFVRLTPDGMLKECALWRDGRVLSEEEIAALNRVELPFWDESFSWEENGEAMLKAVAAAAGRPGQEACFFVRPLYSDEELSGVVIAEKAEPWTEQEAEIAGHLVQMAKSAFLNRNYSESQMEQTWVFNRLMDNLRTNIYVTDMETDEILFMNKTMREAYGIKHPVGQICWKVLQKDLTERCIECPVNKLKQAEEENASCVWEEHSTLTGRYYENYDSTIRWIDGRIVHCQHSVDITDSKEIMSAASYDELTGLFNRRAGKERLEKVLRRAQDEDVPVTVCLYDVNLLKMVNDTYGHIEGDLMLTTISKAVTQMLETDQFAFRLSGDEFMIVFYNCTEAEADVAVKKIQDRISCARKRMKKQYEIGFCYGLKEAPRTFAGIAKLIAEADECMYMRKRAYHSSRLNRERAERQDVTHFTYDKEHLYEALVASTDNYVYLCNMKTNLYRFPPKMVEEFGLPGEVIYDAGNLWAQHIEDEKRHEFQKQLEDLVTGRSDTHDLTYRACNKDGAWVKVRCRGTVSRDENGQAELFAGIMTRL